MRCISLASLAVIDQETILMTKVSAKAKKRATGREKVGQRVTPRQGFENAVAAVLRRARGRWMTAGEITHQLGLSSWGPVAQALLAMAERGLVDREVVDVRKGKGSARANEQSRVYRWRPQAQGQVLLIATAMPAWLAPQGIVQLGESRRVYGRAGIAFSRPDDGDEED